MSTASVTIRYDGPDLADHQMDVADLAPALLGLSELCKIANRKFNGDRASVKVLINTDREHNCFQFDLVLVQSIWDTTKALVTGADAAAAKEVAAWLGIASGGVAGLFQLVKWLRGRRIEETKLELTAGGDVVSIRVEGDGNNVIVAHPQSLALLRDEAAIANVKKVVQPVAKEGYESLEFESEGRTVERVDKPDALAVVGLDPSKIEETELDKPQLLTAWVTVYSPVYDLEAPMWRFKFGDKVEYMDITQTSIAEQAIKRGCAMIDDAYYVRLELRQEHRPTGKITNHFKIVEVLEFKPARPAYQADMFRVDPK